MGAVVEGDAFAAVEDGEEAVGGVVEDALPVAAGDAEGAGAGDEARPSGPVICRRLIL